VRRLAVHWVPGVDRRKFPQHSFPSWTCRLKWHASADVGSRLGRRTHLELSLARESTEHNAGILSVDSTWGASTVQCRASALHVGTKTEARETPPVALPLRSIGTPWVACPGAFPPPGAAAAGSTTAPWWGDGPLTQQRGGGPQRESKCLKFILLGLRQDRGLGFSERV